MSAPLLFNSHHRGQQRLRSAGNFPAHRFLHEWCEREILDRLAIIRREFPQAAFIGPQPDPGFVTRLKTEKSLQSLRVFSADTETLAIDAGSLDLVISSFALHAINDLPGLLIQIRRALKPDGLFIACMPGGETLHELRNVMMDAELAACGGASPHVFPFADKQQMGSLLQRAGFALPVVDSDILSVAYGDLLHLMRDLRGMGEANTLQARRKSFTPRGLFASAQTLYAERFSGKDGKLTASFELISLIGWAPHASQPQPLKPGSGQVNLAKALEA